MDVEVLLCPTRLLSKSVTYIVCVIKHVLLTIYTHWRFFYLYICYNIYNNYHRQAFSETEKLIDWVYLKDVFVALGSGGSYKHI